MDQNTKLYVGNLNYDTTDERLQELFSSAGTVVSASVIKDKFSGRSKGFGFVEMSTPEEAQAGIDMYNGKTVDERDLTVNIARPLADRPPRREGGAGGFRGGNGGGHESSFFV